MRLNLVACVWERRRNGMLAALSDNAAAGARTTPAASSAAPQQQRRSDDVLQLLAKLAIKHDRQIQEVADRSTFAVVAQDKDIKKALLNERKKWTDAMPKERGVPHPCGHSQRTVVWARMVATLQAQADQPSFQANPEAKKALEYLIKMEPKMVDKNIFRLKPKYAQPHVDEDRAWVGDIVVGVAAENQFREALFEISGFDVRFKGIKVAPARTEDGPLVRELEKWIKGGGKGGGRGGGKGWESMEVEAEGRARKTRRGDQR